MKMIIAGVIPDLNIAKEFEDIVRVSLLGSRIRELSHIDNSKDDCTLLNLYNSDIV